jgi:hypothetical protein
VPAAAQAQALPQAQPCLRWPLPLTLPAARARQVFTAVEDFGSAMAKLRELGFSVDGEASELVYRAGAEVEVDDEAFAK